MSLSLVYAYIFKLLGSTLTFYPPPTATMAEISLPSTLNPSSAETSPPSGRQRLGRRGATVAVL